MSEEEPTNVFAVSNLISSTMRQSGYDIELNNENIKTLNDFKIYLTKKLSDMMDRDYDGVINLLYRIDVGEEELHELFSPQNKEYIPSALADLIINRQIQKIRWRMKIKNGEA